MAGFIRRYGSMPNNTTLQEIEGVDIIDLPPPGSITGVGIGTVAIVGEFANMTYADDPVEAFGSQDMLEKVGTWDETLGQFGGDGGNGFVAVRGKKYRRLVCVPIDMTTGNIRVFRDLPLAASATNVEPATPLVAAILLAGFELLDGTDRVRTAANSEFTAPLPTQSGVDGETFPAATSAITFGSAGAAFVNADVGRILVPGTSGTAAANRGTFRVISRVSGTEITVQNLDGTAPTFTNATSLPWRLYDGAAADTGGTALLATATASDVLARSLDSGTIAAATVLTPTTAPDATSPLAGLAATVHPTVALTDPDAKVGASYPANDALLDALYATAIDTLLGDEDPEADVNIVFSARHSDAIRSKLREHVLLASQYGLGRLAINSPEVNTTSFATVTGDADPGVGADRHERVLFAWPGHNTFIPEAAGVSITGADAVAYTTGFLDLACDSLLASVISNLDFNRNPGQASAPIPSLMALVNSVQRGVTGLNLARYISMRQNGIVGLRRDKTSGYIFQSGVTTSLTSGQTNISRRRTADFIQDSAAARLNQLVKEPLTEALKTAIWGEFDEFLAEQLSANNPAAQKIHSYAIDVTSGNTDAKEALGIWVIIGRIRTLATLDKIVLQVEAGASVSIVAA